jgi:hypothetical protein
VKGLPLLLLLLPGLALASVGKVSILEGTASRTDASGQEQALKVGAEVELKDTLQVGEASNLKLLLTDESVIMLGANSQLYIEEATFEGQERKGFSAKLVFGRIWAKVKQMAAGSEAKFEVTTERAVAGVRGTIFRVDYGSTAKTVTPAVKPNMVVRVVQGRVVVQIPKPVKKQAPVAQSTPPAADGKKPARTLVPGPQQVTLSQWMELFADLQAGEQTEVGDRELGAKQDRVVRPLDKKAMQDDFGRFVDHNQ